MYVLFCMFLLYCCLCGVINDDIIVQLRTPRSATQPGAAFSRKAFGSEKTPSLRYSPREPGAGTVNRGWWSWDRAARRRRTRWRRSTIITHVSTSRSSRACTSSPYSTSVSRYKRVRLGWTWRPLRPAGCVRTDLDWRREWSAIRRRSGLFLTESRDSLVSSVFTHLTAFVFVVKIALLTLRRPHTVAYIICTEWAFFTFL